MANSLNHGSLFSGIGGFDLAAQWMGWKNLFHCEWNPFGQRVLKHYWHDAELFTDITKSDFTKYANRIDILTGGFPCTDASIAGPKTGLAGKRTGLFFEMLRVIKEIKPRYVVAENVANLCKINNGRDFQTILKELAGMGYNAEWRICYASEKGAPHRRARLYLVAYSNSINLKKDESFIPYVQESAVQIGWRLSRTVIQIWRGGYWSIKPEDVCLDDGLYPKLAGITVSKHRNESIKAYGNAVVPQVVYQIFKAIQQYEDKQT